MEPFSVPISSKKIIAHGNQHMTESPNISVIIPTCQRTELLLTCVASILKGDYHFYEIIVIDQERSQTLKQRLIQEYSNETRIRYFFLDEAGASRARNLGLQKANGEIVAFIDDDAVADSGWLKAIAEAFVTVKPTPALIGGRIDPIWLNRKPKWYPKEREFLLGLYDIGNQMCPMPEHDQPIGANMAGLRDVIIKLGGFDENLGPNYFRKRSMLTGEETILGKRVKNAGYQLYYQPKAYVYHRISPKKLTISYFLKRHFWEGVTTISQIFFLDELKSNKKNHIFYHSQIVVKSIARAILPKYKKNQDVSPSEMRMLSLSKTAFSLGVLYGLLTLNYFDKKIKN